MALVIGGLSITSALARDDRDHDRDHRHDRHEWRGDHHGYWQPYAQPVYVPPPVYYQPRQSPGISLFLPLDLRHR